MAHSLSKQERNYLQMTCHMYVGMHTVYIYTKMGGWICLPACLFVYSSSEASNKSCWNSCTNSVKLQIKKTTGIFILHTDNKCSNKETEKTELPTHNWLQILRISDYWMFSPRGIYNTPLKASNPREYQGRGGCKTQRTRKSAVKQSLLEMVA